MNKEKELIKAEFIEVLLNSNDLQHQLDGHLLQSSERIHKQLEMLRNAVLLCDDIDLKQQVYYLFEEIRERISKYKQDYAETITPVIQDLEDFMDAEENNISEKDEESASSLLGLPNLMAMGNALCQSDDPVARSDGRLMMITGALIDNLVNTLFKALMFDNKDAFKELLSDLERSLENLNK